MPAAARLYERVLLALGGLMPAVPIAYLWRFQTPDQVYEDHAFHILAIGVAIAEAGFVSYVTWLCYKSSGERFLRWLTLGLLAFTLVYAPHGFLTPVADHNIWLFLLYGPASRLAMSGCLLVGLLVYGGGAHDAAARRDRRFWYPAIALLLALDGAVAVLACSPYAGLAVTRMSLEIGALVGEGAALLIMLARRIRSPLMDFYLLALCYFALSSLAFLLARPWSHMWWLAHAVFAAGFFLLSYGVARAYQTTRSFGAVYRQEEMMARLTAAKAAAEESLRRLTATQASLVQAEKMAALGRLVAGVAHEINTPVGTILSAVSHLDERTAAARASYAACTFSEDDLLEYFDEAARASRMITVNGRRAADLILSFKQVAVDQTGRPRRRFDLKTYLEEILMSLEPNLRQAGHSAHLSCPPGIEMDSDPGALSQCLTNLVTNSLVHAFDDGQDGSLSISVTQPRPDTVTLTYADTGRGIPPDLQDRVFEPFFTTSRSHGGSGLGLHIAFNAVTGALGGTMRLVSAPGQGAAFILSIPRHLPSAAPGSTPAAAPAGGAA